MESHREKLVAIELTLFISTIWIRLDNLTIIHFLTLESRWLKRSFFHESGRGGSKISTSATTFSTFCLLKLMRSTHCVSAQALQYPLIDTQCLWLHQLAFTRYFWGIFLEKGLDICVIDKYVFTLQSFFSGYANVCACNVKQAVALLRESTIICK